MKNDILRRLHGGCGESLTSQVTGLVRRPAGQRGEPRRARRATAHLADRRPLGDKS